MMDNTNHTDEQREQVLHGILQSGQPAPIGADALRHALEIAEAALADIGDADREPGDDVAWCEARAAEALPTVRAALASAAQPALTVTARYDLSPAAIEGAIRDKLIEMGWTPPGVAAPKAAPAQTITEQDAYDMGAKGAPATEAERLLFEAWMRGHCWGLGATWNGKEYRSDCEHPGYVDPIAMGTRRLWAAWRDRAALAAAPKAAPLAPAAVAGPSDEMVLAAARVLSPSLFLHGLEPLPKDGPNTALRMRQEAALARCMLDAAFAAAPTTQAAPTPAAQGDAPGWIKHGHTFGGKPRLALEIDPSDFYGITDAIHHALEQLDEHEDPDASPLDQKRSRRLRQALMAAWLREYPQEAARTAQEGDT